MESYVFGTEGKYLLFLPEHRLSAILRSDAKGDYFIDPKTRKRTYVDLSEYPYYPEGKGKISSSKRRSTGPKPYSTNIERETLKNRNYRKVLHTSENLQLVVMNLDPLETIPLEVHPNVDQFIRVERGNGLAIVNGKRIKLSDGSAVIVPKGTYHEIVNASDYEPLLLYTIYSPPEHPPKTIQRTKRESES